MVALGVSECYGRWYVVDACERSPVASSGRWTRAMAGSPSKDGSRLVATPIYSLALLDGFGHMGNNAHWFSDVTGAALLGVGTTELLIIRLHKRHQTESNRWRIFSMSASSVPMVSTGLSIGLGAAYSWSVMSTAADGSPESAAYNHSTIWQPC
jgi:hypothetical protein